MEKAFVNISKELVLSGAITAKMMLVLSYLRIFASYLDEVRISIVWLVQNIGYKPKSGSGNITQQIQQILFDLRDRGAIYFDDPESTTSQLKIKLDTSHPYFAPAGSFVQITSDEFLRITGSSYKRRDWLLLVFFLIKGRMYYNARDQTMGVAYPSLKRLHAEIVGSEEKMSFNSLIKVLDELVAGGLLKKYSVGEYFDGRPGVNEVRSFPVFYALWDQTINPDECVRIARDTLALKGIEVDRFFHKNDENNWIEDDLDEYKEELI